MMLCAAAQKPHLFSHLLIYDPPWFSLPTKIFFGGCIKFFPSLTGRIFPPVRAAFRKKGVWASREDARTFLSTKGVFKTMHPESFEAFITHGLTDRPDGSVDLTFPGNLEGQIFLQAPLDLPFLSHSNVGLYTSGNIQPPGWFIFSEQYTLIGKADVQDARFRLPSLRFMGTPHSHYYPLEEPERFADMAAELLQGEQGFVSKA